MIKVVCLLVLSLLVSCSHSKENHKTVVKIAVPSNAIIPKYATTISIKGHWPIEYSIGYEQIQKHIEAAFSDCKISSDDPDIEILYSIDEYKTTTQVVDVEDIKFHNNLAHMPQSHTKQIQTFQITSHFKFMIKDTKIPHIFFKKIQSLSYNITQNQTSEEIYRSLLELANKYIQKWLRRRITYQQVELVGNSDITKNIVDLVQQKNIQGAIELLNQKINEINYTLASDIGIPNSKMRLLKTAYYNRGQLFRILKRHQASKRDLMRANNIQ